MQPGQLKFDASVKSLAYTSACSWEEFLAYDNDLRGEYLIRLGETRLDGDAQLFFNSYPDTLYFVALVAVDDPDSLAVLPVLARIVAAGPRFGLRIVRDDGELALLDALLDDTRQFQRALGRDDQSRLDQYLTSVREIEQRLNAARQWELRPKPTTNEQPPDDIRDQKQFFEKFDLMLSMARLAFESDSTRIITLMVDAFATPPFNLHPNQNTTDGYHNLSHHGQSESKVQQLMDADHQQMMLLHKLFTRLTEVREDEDRLLDRTMILFGSNMGDANTHDNTNMPILLAGGGFKHGQHLAFRHDRNQPLCNLFVTMLQKLGVETESFASSSGTLNEIASNT